MGTLKVGNAEEQLISDIEKIKEKHKKQMEGVCLGVKLARKQIPDVKNEVIQSIVKQMDKTLKRLEQLNQVIQGIEFSKDHDEEKFHIAWCEFNDKSGSYCTVGYGKPILRKPLTEMQFVFALTSWEKEVCKRLTLVKELEGSTFEPICAGIEQDIRNLLYKYVGQT